MEKGFTRRREEKEGAKGATIGRSPCNVGQRDAASVNQKACGAALSLCAFESFAPLREPLLCGLCGLCAGQFHSALGTHGQPG